MYHCGLCEAKTSDIQALKKHRQNKHKGKSCVTKKEKVAPPPMCDPKNAQHTSECCERDLNNERPHIYTKEERKQNGVCVEWNKGCCEELELCKFNHVEIEECRYANFCSRSNCRFFHDVKGMFPFLEDTQEAQGRRQH